ncbi:hypothetical protein BJ508DRAFT_410623 [Ascobolus immersus RN42]|uniref:Uncharacterized protein n=1 Tax=Ascobolus immersus RN42 TaxID=1160509 RepID=A0A3N4IZH1_ASCIM|nr:hypothetical protein BJ508DRAFT_410623 [Ascobolus immersus RN42]
MPTYGFRAPKKDKTAETVNTGKESETPEYVNWKPKEYKHEDGTPMTEEEIKKFERKLKFRKYRSRFWEAFNGGEVYSRYY